MWVLQKAYILQRPHEYRQVGSKRKIRFDTVRLRDMVVGERLRTDLRDTDMSTRMQD